MQEPSKMKQFIADILDVAGFPGLKAQLDQDRTHLAHLKRAQTGIIITREYKK